MHVIQLIAKGMSQGLPPDTSLQGLIKGSISSTHQFIWCPYIQSQKPDPTNYSVGSLVMMWQAMMQHINTQNFVWMSCSYVSKNSDTGISRARQTYAEYKQSCCFPARVTVDTMQHAMLWVYIYIGYPPPYITWMTFWWWVLPTLTGARSTYN